MGFGGLLNQLATTTGKIVTGSYVGTGIYGENYKNQLTFPFEPKLIIVYKKTSVPTGAESATSPLFMIQGFNGTIQYGQWGYNGATWDGNTVSWYGPSLYTQLNESGIEYPYIAIG